MRFYVKFCLVLIVFFSIIPAFWGQTAEPASPNAPSGKLKILSEEFPPLNFTKFGKPAGLSVDVVQEICKRLNRPCKINFVQWNKGYNEALSKPNIVLFSTSRSAQRENLFKWVGPLVKSGLGFYVKKDSNIVINSLQDAKKIKRIGTVKDYASEQFLEKTGFKNLVNSKDPSTCVHSLMNGWIDVWVMPDITMAHTAINAGISPGNLKRIFGIKEPANYIAFSRQTPDSIVEMWQKKLDTMKEDGTYNRIIEKWLGYQHGVKNHKLSEAQLRKAKTVKLNIFTEEWPPINFTKNGKLTGFAVELVIDIMQRQNRILPIKIKPWHEGYKAIKQIPNSALFATTRTPVRENLFKWVGPLFTQSWCFIGKKGSNIKLDFLDDAKKLKKIGVYKNDFSEQFLKENGFKNLYVTQNNTDNIKLLKEGKIDLWMTSSLTLVYEALEAGFDPLDFEIVLNITEMDLYIAFSKDTPDEVVWWWQNTLNSLKCDGIYLKLVEKWIPSLKYKQDLANVAKSVKTTMRPSVLGKPGLKTKAKVKLTPSAEKWLSEHPVIKLAPDPDCEPLEYFEGNIYKGIGADFAKLTGSKLGINFKIIHCQNWDETIEKIKKHEVDMLGAISPTPDRAKYLNFTKPYIEMPVCIIVRREMPEKLTVEDLKTMEVTVVKGYAIQEFMEKKYPAVTLDLVPNAEAGLKKVATKRSDAVLLDMVDASYWIDKAGITNLKEAGKTGYVYRLGFAVRKDWPELVEILNTALDGITKEEEMLVKRKWISLGMEKGLTRKQIYISLAVFGILLLIVFGIFGWNRALSRLVEKKTTDLQRELVERKKAEKEISNYRDHLEDLVKERTEALKVAKEEAEAGARAKAEFLANMSHEIRTPLNAVLGFSQLMRKDSSLNHEQQNYLEVINRSGEHLLELINQILEMSKIEAGHTKLNEDIFDLEKMLRDLELMFRIRTETNSIILNFIIPKDLPKYINADGGKLRQVLINLLGNSVKFTKKGHIKLTVEYLPNQAQLLFHIEDTGPGISKEEMNKIFAAFSQTDVGIKSGGGTGLGLAISQNYVKLMGGEIKVESHPGKGTVFSFEIKITVVERGKDEDSDVPVMPVIGLKTLEKPVKILIIEDEEENRHLLVKMLSLTGFELEEADNGQDGLKIWEKWRPDLIFTDIRMPVMDGYSTTEKIKTSSEGKNTVVIALTASVFEEDKKRILEAGCDDFLRKPFKENQLFEIIRKHLNIEYIYEKEKEKAETKSDIKEMIKTLPQDLRDNLRAATQKADFNQIIELIKAVAGYNKDVAVELEELANSFEYDKLMEYL